MKSRKWTNKELKMSKSNATLKTFMNGDNDWDRPSRIMDARMEGGPSDTRHQRLLGLICLEF
jgi:hypothetical protein